MKRSGQRCPQTFPAARATACVPAALEQTLGPHVCTPPGTGDIQLRINPFVSLFAASLIALLPTHALAQTSPSQTNPTQSSPGAPGQPVEPTPSQQVDDQVRRTPVGVREREHPGFENEGRRLGAFVLNASVELAVTSTDNLFAAESFEDCDPPPPGETCPGEVDDIIYSVNPMARLESDWSRHMLAFEAGAGLRMHDETSNEDAETYYVRSNGRFDIGTSTALRGSARAAHQVTPRTDPDVPTEGEPVEYDRVDTSIGIEHRFARLTVSADATRSRYDYEGNQSDRDNEQTGLRGRAVFEVSPRLGLLLTAGYDERDYDALPNFSSEAQTYLAGVALDGDLLRGEISVGTFEREYNDPAIGTLDGLAVAAQVDWFVTQLTTLSFSARRDADDQISANLRLPYVTEEYGARIDHELLRNVILTAAARVGEREYETGLPDPRRDDYVETEIGADWILNRRASLRLRYERDETESDGVPASRDYEVNAVTVGLTLRL